MYDASVIQEFADSLYRQARSVIIRSTLLVAILGVVVSAILVAAAKMLTFIIPSIIIGGVIGGFFGHSIGKEHAFKLKLAAQVALCQVQIEKNTKQRVDEQ